MKVSLRLSPSIPNTYQDTQRQIHKHIDSSNTAHGTHARHTGAADTASASLHQWRDKENFKMERCTGMTFMKSHDAICCEYMLFHLHVISCQSFHVSLTLPVASATKCSQNHVHLQLGNHCTQQYTHTLTGVSIYSSFRSSYWSLTDQKQHVNHYEELLLYRTVRFATLSQVLYQNTVVFKHLANSSLI